MKTVLQKEWRIFCSALMFLTRIPVPSFKDYHKGYLQEAPRYFSWVGLIIGSVIALVWLLCSHLFPSSISVLLAMLSGIWITGAFHEDGLADVFDGFGGGWTKERILVIMKDSRLGTYGVIGLISALALRYLLLLQLTELPEFVMIVLLTQSASRLFAVYVMQILPYSGDPESAKSKEATGKRMGFTGLLFSTAAILIPCIQLPPLLLWSLLPAALGAMLMALYFRKWIGGITGDCLGSIQQITELLLLGACYILLKKWTYT